ncbi:transporter [Massilia alkalitolerans]|uniref:transporter n=1 Tax=Massilia alkalitolerans TaxID=286638 RepID=UPI0028A94B48|nr:transporter [Massilia alkalitolerans]
MRPSAILAAAAGLALTLGAAGVRAQDVIESGRPDFVESSTVVGKGRFQLEAGLQYERERGGAGRERILSTPAVLRFGVADTVELRVETEGRMNRHLRADGERSTDAGYGDTTLALGWHLVDAAAGRPSVGLLASAEFDSGSRAFRGQGVRPALRVIGEWTLPNGMALGVMPGIGIEREDAGAGRYRYGLFGIVLAKSFGERLRGIVEVALPHIARGKHGGTEASFDIGAAYLLSNDVQLDAMLSRGLNSRTPDFAFTIGLSIRH